MRNNIFLLFVLSLSSLSCNDTENDNAQQDPSTVHPETEAITDSTKIVNDSVIVVDTADRNRGADKKDK